MKTLLERIVVNFLRKPKEPPVAPKKTLLEQITEEFVREEYTDDEKRDIGIPPDVVSKGGKWYRGDVYAGRVRDGIFVPASEEPEDDKEDTDGEEPTDTAPEPEDGDDGGEEEDTAGTDVDVAVDRNQGTKNKSLEPGESRHRETEAYTRDTGITDEEYEENEVVESNYEDEDKELTEEGIEEFFEDQKVPRKYITAITRLINTQQRTKDMTITDVIQGVGAGELRAQAAEILTVAGVGMTDDQFDGLMNVLEAQVSEYSDGARPIINQAWLDAVAAQRAIILRRYDVAYGAGNWEVEAVAWDVKEDFEALGNDNYEDNKGYSSDMYVRVRVGEQPLLDEISLKQDSKSKLFNGAVTDSVDWYGEVGPPPQADPRVYKQGEGERVETYISDAAGPIDLDPDKLETMLTTGDILKPENKALRSTLIATGIIRLKNSKRPKDGWELNPQGKKMLDTLGHLEYDESGKLKPESVGTALQDALGKSRPVKDQTRIKKLMIMHAAISSVQGSDESLDFLDRHIGYTRDKDGQYPEGSIKRFQDDTIQSLVDSPTATEGLLGALSEKLPLRSLISGEESMAIGGLSADPTTLSKVFGVDNYEDFKAGLTMQEDDDGGKYLVYESKGPPAKNVKIATVKVRQKGLGYASTVGLEFDLADDFTEQLYVVNQDIYPPPPVTDKERKRFDRRLAKKKQLDTSGFRPLLRSLIIRELDRIKNGN